MKMSEKPLTPQQLKNRTAAYQGDDDRIACLVQQQVSTIKNEYLKKLDETKKLNESVVLEVRNLTKQLRDQNGI
jgi:hypothetical protein